jgi:signal transduction histidine kinase
MKIKSAATTTGFSSGGTFLERERALPLRWRGPSSWLVTNQSVFLLCVAVFGVIAILGATDYYGIMGAVNRHRSWWFCLLWSIPTALCWALLTPIILRFSRRWSFEKGQRIRTVFRHLALLAALAPLEVVLDLGLTVAGMVAADTSSLATQVNALPSGFLSGLARAPIVYVVLAGFGATMGLYDRYLERVAEEARLKDALAQTRLQALGTMLNPHFLFNTLNAIGPLSRKDAKATNHMVALLGGLLRRSLDGAKRRMVPLKEEMEFIKDYIQIVSIRSAEPLDVEYEIPEDALEVLVPNMILQPIVENAIRHGLAHRHGLGRLTFRARVDRGFLQLEIDDNGTGLDKKKDGAIGFGLGLTRERIAGIYGQNGSLELAGRPEGGVRATFRLPRLEVSQDCEEMDSRDYLLGSERGRFSGDVLRPARASIPSR